MPTARTISSTGAGAAASTQRVGGRKRQRNDNDDDENNNNSDNNNGSDEGTQRKSRRKKTKKQRRVEPVPQNSIPAAQPAVSAAVKAQRDAFVELYAHKINALRGKPRKEVYGGRKKIIVEALQLYGGWLTERRLTGRADYLWEQHKLNSTVNSNTNNIGSSSNSGGSGEGSNNTPSPSTSSSNNVSSEDVTTHEDDTIDSGSSGSGEGSNNTPSTSSSSNDVSSKDVTMHNDEDVSPTLASNAESAPPTEGCSYANCIISCPPKQCSVNGCTSFGHGTCQLFYGSSVSGRDFDDDTKCPPPRCREHETLFWQQQQLEVSTCASTSTPTHVAPSNNSSQTRSNAQASVPVCVPIGCDWRDVDGGGCHDPNLPLACKCGGCGRLTHHVCQVEYESKRGDTDDGHSRVRCSHCVDTVVRIQPEDSSGEARASVTSTISLARTTSTSKSLNSGRGGRPKGKASDRDALKRKKAEMTNYLAAAVKDAQKKAPNGVLPKGTFPQLHQKALEKFGLKNTDVQVKSDTIRKRISRGKLTVTSMGPTSPMAEVEHFLKALLIQACEAGEPINPTVFLEIANSLIEGSTVKEKLRQWNIDRGLDTETPLSMTYYKSFLKRHDLESKVGERKSTMRVNDLDHANVHNMYNLVYERMVEAGVAVNLPKQQYYFIDSDGNETTDESEKCGETCTQKIIHPERCLYADEIGCDTCQEEDGHIGGTKYIAPKGMKALLRGCKTSNRWTLFAITAGTGEIVMYVIIFAASELSFLARMGLDMREINSYDENVPLEDQVGPGKIFPGAPTSTYQGKEVPAYITFNKKGSMTGEILAGVLKRMDELELFPRGPDKSGIFFLVDAHPSRLSAEVLRYANEEVHGRPRYYLTIGLPNATEAWQAADSSELNGTTKTELTKAKDEYMKELRALKLPEVLRRSDVLPLLHTALPKSYGQPYHVLRALLDRGWLHMNRKLESDPRILQRTTSSASGSVDGPITDTVALGLNVSTGAAGNATMTYMDQLNRNDQVAENRERREAAATQGQANLQHLRNSKLNGGILFNNNHVALDSEVRDLVEEKEQDKADKQYAAFKKKATYYNGWITKHEELLNIPGQQGEPRKCPELKAWIHVRLLKTDGKVPGKKAELLAMKNRLANRQPQDLAGLLVEFTKHDEEQVETYLEQFWREVEEEEEDTEELGGSMEDGGSNGGDDGGGMEDGGSNGDDDDNNVPLIGI